MAKNYFSNRTDIAIERQLLATKELIKFFRIHCGVYAYICYGTLLGSIRDNNVIPGDSDYDIAYLSKGTNLKEVREELIGIAKILIEHKLLLKIWVDGKGILNPKVSDLNINFLGQMHVKSPNSLALLDVFSSWITNNKYYLCPHIQGQLIKSDITPFISSKIRNINFVVPKNSEKLLENIYGNSWKIPSDKKSKNKRIWMSNYE